MKIWKNTNTLSGYDDDIIYTENKKHADIALLGSKPINIKEFTNLKGIFRAGIGRDNVPIIMAEKKGIMVRFPSMETIDIIYSETANFTCGMIFNMFYSEVGTLDPWVKYDRVQLQDKKLLVIGTGNIGNRVAEKMQIFMEVLTYDTIKDSQSSLHELLSVADCVTLHIPSLPENRAFIDSEKLSTMKNGSILINTARGAVVDEDALFNEIKTNRLKAAFDVYWEEPYCGKLKEFHPKNFYMTPHVASTCSGFLEGCRRDLDILINELSND